MNTALITGFTGQDGGLLARFLLEKDYKVVGLVRRISTEPPPRLRQLGLGPYLKSKQLVLARGDVTDVFSIIDVLKAWKPNEVYNLAAQSDVGISFEQPLLTTQVNHGGVLNLLGAIRALNMEAVIRLYQASTSELFGGTAKRYELQIQDEDTPFWPVSPYGIAKLAAHHAMVAAREAMIHPIRIACGILFNHESEWRGGNFVTRKITLALARIHAGKQNILHLGNLSAERDWGYANDYVDAMWRMLQQTGGPHNWKDFIIATGVTHTIKEFVEAACRVLDWTIEWKGKGEEEKGYIDGTLRVAVDSQFFRPNEVWRLYGNPAKAKELLDWEPETSFDELVAKMMAHDLKQEGVSTPVA